MWPLPCWTRERGEERFTPFSHVVLSLSLLHLSLTSARILFLSPLLALYSLPDDVADQVRLLCGRAMASSFSCCCCCCCAACALCAALPCLRRAGAASAYHEGQHRPFVLPALSLSPSAGHVVLYCTLLWSSNHAFLSSAGLQGGRGC